MRFAALAGLALALAACGGSTGVRDAGSPPQIQGPARTVQLWFIRPGGRVGVERDLVPVATRIRAFPEDLPRLVLRRLERGPSYQLQLAGFRSVLSCCGGGTGVHDGVVTVPELYLRWPISGLLTGFGETVANWTALAGAAQVQRTLAALPGVRSVVVQGLSEAFVRKQLASGADTVTPARARRGTCAAARTPSTATTLAVRRTSNTRIVAHVRAPMPLVLELNLNSSTQEGSSNSSYGATTVPCGIFDVEFSGGALASGGGSPFEVRAAPLAGPPRPGVTRRAALSRPVG
jgi:hypothetical protein